MRVAWPHGPSSGALGDPLSQPDRRPHRAWSRGGHLRRRPSARRAVSPRRRAARPGIAHLLSDPLAGRPRGALARRGATHRGASRERAPTPPAHARSVPLLAPGLDPRPAATHRAVPAGAALRRVLLRLRDGCAARTPPPSAGRPRWALVVAFRGADTTKYVARRGPRVYARTFREARLLLPVCEFLARRIVQLGAPAERVVVHRTGIDLRRWPYRERHPARPGSLRLVSVGRLVEKKGIAHVLRRSACWWTAASAPSTGCSAMARCVSA